MFNNSDFGKKIKTVTKGLFYQDNEIGVPSPPITNYYLIDDSGAYLDDDSDDKLITD